MRRLIGEEKSQPQPATPRNTALQRIMTVLLIWIKNGCLEDLTQRTFPAREL